MSVTYFKRFRMEIELLGRAFPRAVAPSGYRLIPWSQNLLEAHASTKYESFRHEIDSNVFSCLGDPVGCQRLMSEISRKSGFLAEATWLVGYRQDELEPEEFVGTIQGIRDASGLGSVQNLGVVPGHRSAGLGTQLMYQALRGFRSAGLKRAYLEVTAQNEGAVRLYERLGFVRTRTVYKAVEVAAAAW